MYGFQETDDPDTRKGIKIDFNNAPVVSEEENIPFEIYTSNATMSDKEGNLLFYTNGCEIANKNHEIMMNGDNLNPGEVHDFICHRGYAGTNQSFIVLPGFAQERYLLFHKSQVFDSFYGVFSNKLLYTEIDMSLDDGLGEVVIKNNLILSDTMRAGEMTAIKHENGIDWWLLSGRYDSNEFFSFLIDESGISDPMYQSVGAITNNLLGDGSGQVIFSPDGTRYARYNQIDGLYLYDFDRNTGLLSNFQAIEVDTFQKVGGCAFSSNSRFLYVSTRNFLYQFDMEEDDIAASKILIDTYDWFADPGQTSFYQMQLAPDCRIFMNSTNAVDELHVIHNPNEKGLACNFEQRGFQLTSNHQFSMPHFPYYRMDTGFPICDTSLVVSSMDIPVVKRPKIKVFPNPTSDYLTLSFSESSSQKRQALLVNLLGQQIADFSIAAGSPQVELDLVDIPKGIYLLQIVEEGKLIATEKVQIIR